MPFTSNPTKNKMRLKITFSFLLLGFISLAQNPDKYIPRSAVSVFTLNNVALFDKIKMDHLVQYEFMGEVQQELFDGSTNGKTLEDLGLNYDQRLHVFFGKNDRYEIAGFSFGIRNLNDFFTVFDDFENAPSPYSGVDLYTSHFNHLYIKDGVGVLVRVDPTQSFLNQQCDMMWQQRNGTLEIELWGEEEILEIEDQLENDFLNADGYTDKGYFDFCDSLRFEFKQQFMDEVALNLFVKGENLHDHDAAFQELLLEETEGVFFMDNARNLREGDLFAAFKDIFPAIHNDLLNLYKNNKITGTLKLDKRGIKAELSATYDEMLGSIYKKLNNTRFDNRVRKYIHEDHAAFFTYNVNLREAYEKAFSELMPVLRQETNPQLSEQVLMVDLLNDLVNKDALFNTYRGSLFCSFTGLQKINVSKIEYTYDENFNYTETRVESEEEMPLFTFGISTKRNDIPEKILRHLSRRYPTCQKIGDAWKFEEALLGSIPLYVINVNKLVVFTNDEDLALNHAYGYKKEKLGLWDYWKAKSSGFVYGKIDWTKTLEELPESLFSPEQSELLSSLVTKSGKTVIRSSKTKKDGVDYSIRYQFADRQKDPGAHVLDLVNSLFLITR